MAGPNSESTTSKTSSDNAQSSATKPIFFSSEHPTSNVQRPTSNNLKLLVFPEQAVIPDATVAWLNGFVRDGGTVLVTGDSLLLPAIQRLAGITRLEERAIPDGHVILNDAPFDEPTGIDAPWHRLTVADDVTTLYPLYHSWDHDNPGIGNLTNNWPMHGMLNESAPEPAHAPAAICRPLGKGKIIAVPVALFAAYRAAKDPQILRWIRELLQQTAPAPLITTDAPSWVDITLRTKNSPDTAPTVSAKPPCLIVHCVNQNSGRDLSLLNAQDTWVDEIPRVGPYTLTLRLARAPESITLVPGDTPLPFTFRDGILHTQIPSFHIHAALLL